MLRADALQAIYPDIEDTIIVTIMGATAAELYMLGHKEHFFYLEHAMGLASSMGLGIALALPRQRVVVLDGDGSLLMNLGTLSTMARYRPGNLLHIVFDNESLLSVGGFRPRLRCPQCRRSSHSRSAQRGGTPGAGR
jgi:sulfopyruvate decarboxylase subunit beta